SISWMISFIILPVFPSVSKIQIILWFFIVVMLSFPNCKINIGLYITNRRDDGYHDLETVFYPLTPLHDALEIVPAEQSELHVTGKIVSGNKDDNLVWKAYRLLQNDFGGQIGELHIH